MTKPSEITLQKFNEYKAAAETVISSIIEWLEESVGMPVLSLHFDERNDEGFLCCFTFGEPFAESDDTQEEEELEA
jgi:hypothetical protein